MRILIITLTISLLISVALSFNEREHAHKFQTKKEQKTEANKTETNSSSGFKFESSDVSGAGSFDQDLADYKEELQDFKKSQLDRYINQKFRELEQDNGLNTNSWRRLIEGLLDLLDYRQEGLYKLEDQFQLIDKNKDGLIDINEARTTLNDAITLSIKNIEDYLDRKTLILGKVRKGGHVNFDDIKPMVVKKNNNRKAPPKDMH